MVWLTEWLRQIVLIILIATFIDLMLPNSVMQRYVRTVVGLFILVAILSPVLSLLAAGWDESVLNRAMDRLELGWSGSPEAGSRALADIMSEGERMRAANEAQSKQMVEARLATMVTDRLVHLTDYPVHSVQAATGLEESGALVLQSLKVVLAAKPSGDSGPRGREGDSGKQELVKPVEPVQVSIELGRGRPSSAVVSGQPANPVSVEMEEERARLQRLLGQEWQLGERQVSVKFDLEER